MKPDFSGKREIYLEVAEKYESYIRIGILSPGEKLPSVRAAAQEMGINPNTMARAYSYLEERGLIYTLPKKGVYVARVHHDLSGDVTLKAGDKLEYTVYLYCDVGMKCSEIPENVNDTVQLR